MHGQQGRYLFTGILSVQNDTAKHKIKQEHSQSAPKSAAVDYNQGKNKSTNQIYTMVVGQICRTVSFFFGSRFNSTAKNLRCESAA